MWQAIFSFYGMIAYGRPACRLLALGIPDTKPQRILIGKPRRRSELPARHGQHGEALGDLLVEYGEHRRALFQVDLSVRSLVVMAEVISVIVQSLIRSRAGFRSASQA